MSTVTVTLDRADAEAWLGYYREHRLTGWERRCRDALEVALDRDQGTLIRAVAEAIWQYDPGADDDAPSEIRGLPDFEASARAQARAVLEVLAGEGPTDA